MQFQVTARDQANPEKTATAQVYVRVRRDLQPPIFESLPYTVTIPETLEVNRVVFRLRGRDDDKVVRGITWLQFLFWCRQACSQTFPMK